MPNFAGTWKMRSSENFDELLKALGKLVRSACPVCQKAAARYPCPKEGGPGRFGQEGGLWINKSQFPLRPRIAE